ncbi:hypothetical protein [Rhizorhapis suberifaciens]|uniref:Uncharacterized protein n=1 Tax=Rhizorhapis suberifaciens TaxID=13656 RepID=A0A840HTM8_9SPHN|nr:hypothetical protein [Rhizorhapis suberifaciens]MBB4641051.1 hypothetical protein [Rhizorhapis suberifaciens]
MLDFNDYSAVGPREDEDGRGIMNNMAKRFAKQYPAVEGEAHDPLLCGIGRLIVAWGMLEVQLEQKIGQLRRAAGEVRSATSRTKPTMAKMLSELRAIVSMRCRRDNVQLVEIAEVERTIQQIDKFRTLVVQGFQGPADNGHLEDHPFLCRDAKNNVISISLDELIGEVSRLDACRERLLAL